MERLDDDHPAVLRLGRQGRAHGQPAHLPRRVLRVLARLRPEDDAAALEDRGLPAAVPGAARPLLPVDLARAPGDFTARLRGMRTRALGGELRQQHLVHHRGVRPHAEDRLRQVHRPRILALRVERLHRGHGGHLAPFLIGRLRTRTRLPRGPGTAPLSRSRLRAASTLTTRSPRTLTRSPPYRPGMRLPGQTRATSEMPIDPTARCISDTPCVSRWPLKLWRFIAPLNPWPLLVPTMSTTSP